MEQNLLPALVTGCIYLVIHTNPRLSLLSLIADLGMREGVHVLDGGNWLNAYVVAQRLRQQAVDITMPLQRIRFSRAFTCTQMVALVMAAAAESALQPGAVLVLDMLSTFHDENLKQAERLRLLHCCVPHLRHISAKGPVVVCIRPGDPELVDVLAQAADETIELIQPELPAQAAQLTFLKE